MYFAGFFCSSEKLNLEKYVIQMERVLDKNKEIYNSTHVFTGKGKCQVQTAL